PYRRPFAWEARRSRGPGRARRLPGRAAGAHAAGLCRRTEPARGAPARRGRRVQELGALRHIAFAQRSSRLPRFGAARARGRASLKCDKTPQRAAPRVGRVPAGEAPEPLAEGAYYVRQRGPHAHGRKPRTSGALRDSRRVAQSERARAREALVAALP